MTNDITSMISDNMSNEVVVDEGMIPFKGHLPQAVHANEAYKNGYKGVVPCW